MKLHLLLSVFFFLMDTSAFSQVTKTGDSTQMDDSIIDKFEKEVSFPGGDAGWKQYLEKNLLGFNPAVNGAPMGYYTVIAQFIVDKNGTVSDIKPLTKEGYGMEQEVMRVLQKSGKWEPAILNGQPVKAYRKQPVKFVVEETGIEFISQKPYTLYLGVTNELMIHVGKVKDENLFATISKGSIVPEGDGKFNVKVTLPGRVVIIVYNAKKKNKLLGNASFTVLPLRDSLQK